MATAEAFAPAKINLTLHVTGQRPDGFHLLDSLVVFADVGDRLRVVRATRTSLEISGPMAAGVPDDRRNLVLKAADLMGGSGAFHLEKHLPTAAGIGGGSSDAAATLRMLSEMTGRPIPGPSEVLGLGADVPLCLTSGLVRMRGIGECLQPLGTAPRVSLILVNPGIAVPTGAVFANLKRRDFAPMPADIPKFGQGGWIDWLMAQRNDLEIPAISAAPAIGQVLQVLRQSEGCLMARMSGSGATCFAIMREDGIRDDVARDLQQRRPDWWVAPCNEMRADQSGTGLV